MEPNLKIYLLLCLKKGSVKLRAKFKNLPFTMLKKSSAKLRAKFKNLLFTLLQEGRNHLGRLNPLKTVPKFIQWW